MSKGLRVSSSWLLSSGDRLGLGLEELKFPSFDLVELVGLLELRSPDHGAILKFYLVKVLQHCSENVLLGCSAKVFP